MRKAEAIKKIVRLYTIAAQSQHLGERRNAREFASRLAASAGLYRQLTKTQFAETGTIDADYFEATRHLPRSAFHESNEAQQILES
jgi:hypothetical protein